MNNTDVITYYQNFSPVGNLLVIMLSIVLIFLLRETFVTKNRSYQLFRSMIFFVIIAAISDIIYHMMLNYLESCPLFAVYVFRTMHHVMLFFNLYIYVCYILEMISLSKEEQKKYIRIVSVGLWVITVADVLGVPLGYGFRITEQNEIVEGINIFSAAYIFFIGIIFWLLIRYRSRMVTQIYHGILYTYIFCIIVLGVQGIHHQTSYTTANFIFPVISLMYLLHSNPYDPMTGAVDEISFQNTITYSHRNGRKLMLLCLHLQDYGNYDTISSEMKFELFHFFSDIVKRGILFRISGGRLVLAFRLDKNPEYEKVVQQLIAAFDALYQHFQTNFKVVITQTIEEISAKNEYVKLFEFAEKKMSYNEYRKLNHKDIDEFLEQEKILLQLKDIAEKGDLDDARVLAYCQPVYSVRKGHYNTAEALMRMELPGIGFIGPERFIELAERNNIIHPLSLIILNKTCRAIREFRKEGYEIRRISINFSIQEVRDPHFCEDILDVIEKNDIPYECVAVELTESRNETDFDMVKDKIEELKTHGIKFYLDDFGTGYSNFERIMELPFDIIKFDRSLVIESGKNPDSEYMVNTFADMFQKLNYRVLYEGIEDEPDEERCIQMFGQFLQGYKYSKPIPIMELKNFLSMRTKISPDAIDATESA